MEGWSDSMAPSQDQLVMYFVRWVLFLGFPSTSSTTADLNRSWINLLILSVPVIIIRSIYLQ